MVDNPMAFKKRLVHRLALVLALWLGVNAYGTFGIYLIEDTSFIDAIYMSAITLTTLGFSEIIPLSPAGRVFTISCVYVGVTSTGISIALMTNLLFEETLSEFFKVKKMAKKFSELKGHYIVCGYGTTGHQIAEVLLSQGETVVVIDNDVDKHVGKALFMEGDARQDEILLKAQIKNAKGLATTLTQDADNVFVVLTARSLNPELHLVSRYKDDDTEKKLFAAGVNNAVSPYRMGGRRLALSLTTPAIADLVYATHHDTTLAVHFEHMNVPPNAPILNKLLKNSKIREHSMGALIVAITDAAGNSMFNPSPEIRLENIAQLLVLGDEDQLKSLKAYLNEGDKNRSRSEHA